MIRTPSPLAPLPIEKPDLVTALEPLAARPDG
jgi:hypothetical protein